MKSPENTHSVTVVAPYVLRFFDGAASVNERAREFSHKLGSHIKLRRVLSGGLRQSLTIVNHAEIDKGTLQAIDRQALRFLAEADLRHHFYSE